MNISLISLMTVSDKCEVTVTADMKNSFKALKIWLPSGTLPIWVAKIIITPIELNYKLTIRVK